MGDLELDGKPRLFNAMPGGARGILRNLYERLDS
jgi:hypothetical protein